MLVVRRHLLYEKQLRPGSECLPDVEACGVALPPSGRDDVTRRRITDKKGSLHPYHRHTAGTGRSSPHTYGLYGDRKFPVIHQLCAGGAYPPGGVKKQGSPETTPCAIQGTKQKMTANVFTMKKHHNHKKQNKRQKIINK